MTASFVLKFVYVRPVYGGLHRDSEVGRICRVWWDFFEYGCSGSERVPKLAEHGSEFRNCNGDFRRTFSIAVSLYISDWAHTYTCGQCKFWYRNHLKVGCLVKRSPVSVAVEIVTCFCELTAACLMLLNSASVWWAVWHSVSQQFDTI